jgi:glucose-6-phosphate isomerase
MTNKQDYIVNCTIGGSFIATRATTAIVLHHTFPKYPPKKITNANHKGKDIEVSDIIIT